MIALADNAAPVAVDDDGGVVDPGVPVTIAASELLANDTDADGDTQSIMAVHEAVGGRVSLNETGDVVFTPAAGYNGLSSFKCTVTDGTAAAEATYRLEVEVELSEFIGNWWAETIDLSSSELRCYVDCGLSNDIFAASNLRDQIHGGDGHDYLACGLGDDTCVFLDGDGQDDPADFGNGVDAVLLRSVAGFEDFADIISALSEQGTNTLLDLSSRQTILFEDNALGLFTSDHFEFA